MKAQQFVALVQDGATPEKAAKEVGATLETLKKIRPNVEAEVAEILSTYYMNAQLRKAFVRASHNKIVLENINGTPKQQELALKALISMADDEEIAIFKPVGGKAPAALPSQTLPELPDSFANLIEAANLGGESTEDKK